MNLDKQKEEFDKIINELENITQKEQLPNPDEKEGHKSTELMMKEVKIWQWIEQLVKEEVEKERKNKEEAIEVAFKVGLVGGEAKESQHDKDAALKEIKNRYLNQ